MGTCSCAALAIPAPGERTISNAEVPLPRSPLSLAAGSARRKAFLSVLRRTTVSLCVGHLLRWLCKCRKRSKARGAGGGSPRRNKVKVSPFPGGEGGQGDGGKKENQRRGWQASRKASPPPNCRTGRSSQCRAPLSPGDARGEAPCIRKQ